MKKILLTTIAIASFATSALADGLGAELTKVGDWTVFRSTDAMTDIPSCVAIYDGRSFIQMTNDSLSFSYRGRGGIQGYQYRFDDEPASRMQIPSDLERRIGSVFLRGREFSRVQNAQRLRFQGVTLVAGVATEDISLVDVPALMNVLRGPDCKAA